MKLLSIEGFKNILLCDLCQKDIRNLYNGHPESHGYSKWLDRNLNLLDHSMIYDLLHLKQFEPLSGHENIYSIRRPESKGNPRVLFFTIIETNAEPLYILLTAFHEHNSGDYKNAIKVAEARKKTIMNMI